MKTESNQARAAAEIRRILKTAGIKATVKSRGFSGGDAVDVGLIDADPETVKRARLIAAPYQYGHFDGMTDSYEYSNNRSDVPQSKYVHSSVSMSPEMEQRVFDFIRGYFADADKLPELYRDAQNMSYQSEWVSQLAWRMFSTEGSPFWGYMRSNVTLADLAKGGQAV